MSNIDEINQFLQAQLERAGRNSVGAVEASEWLDEVGLLRNSRSRSGKPLRDLLRSGMLVGQRQESNRRWFIDCVAGVDDDSNAKHAAQSQLCTSASHPSLNSATLLSSSEVLPDILVEGLRVVFVGTAVGDASAQKQHYYSDPRNSFYHELYRAKLTPKLLLPEEDKTLPTYGIGLTDLVKDIYTSDDATLNFTTPSIGATNLIQKLERFKPTWICFNGKTAYRAFAGHKARFGQIEQHAQDFCMFVVPSTSGRVAATALFDGRTRCEWFLELATQLRMAQ